MPGCPNDRVLSVSSHPEVSDEKQRQFVSKSGTYVPSFDARSYAVDDRRRSRKRFHVTPCCIILQNAREPLKVILMEYQTLYQIFQIKGKTLYMCFPGFSSGARQARVISAIGERSVTEATRKIFERGHVIETGRYEMEML